MIGQLTRNLHWTDPCIFREPRCPNACAESASLEVAFDNDWNTSFGWKEPDSSIVGSGGSTRASTLVQPMISLLTSELSTRAIRTGRAPRAALAERAIRPPCWIGRTTAGKRPSAHARSPRAGRPSPPRSWPSTLGWTRGSPQQHPRHTETVARSRYARNAPTWSGIRHAPITVLNPRRASMPESAMHEAHHKPHRRELA